MTVDANTLQALFTAARNTGAATLNLPAAIYPPSYLKSLTFAKPLLVTADPGAVFQGLVGQLCAGPVTLQGLAFKVNPGQGAGIRGSFAGWTFDGCEVSGSGPGTDGQGVSLQRSPGVTVQNMNIHDCVGGIGVSLSDDVLITANRIHDIEIDGVQVVGGSRVTVTDNHFTDFYPKPGDHSDAIQFTNSGTVGPQTDITIKGNTYVRGKGPAAVQGIFLGNEAKVDYQRITISDNMLLGTIYQGILVVHADVAVERNTVAGFNDFPTSWIKADTCTGKLVGNIATSLQAVNSPALVQTGNQTIAPIPATDHYSPPVAVVAPPDPIVVLKGQLAAANADLAAMTTRAVTSEASLADALKRLADVGAALSADEAKLAAVRADVGP
jgi:hypothetical protein